MQARIIERSLVTTVPGRYLLQTPEIDPPWPLLVGFHGYGEAAESFLSRAGQLPIASSWLLCSVQALHPFYRRTTGEVVASWMTSLDRKRAVRSNIRYIRKVLRLVETDFSLDGTLVFAGFSQGVAMAYRAAAFAGRRVSAVVALGGDVPPELDSEKLRRGGRILIGHGARDGWYTEEKLQRDAARLKSAGVEFEICRYEGGHDWDPAFLQRVEAFLAEIQAEAEGASGRDHLS